MNTIIAIFKMFLILVIILSCSKDDDCLEGNENTITQTLNLNEFSKISSIGGADINIYQGKTQSVTVTGDSNIIEELSKEVSNDTWKIKPTSDCIKDFDLQINITVTDFTELNTTGSGDIVINAFTNQERLIIQSTGSSDIEINPSIDTQTIKANIRGSGNITLQGDNFTDLQNIEISITGSGDFSGFEVPS